MCLLAIHFQVCDAAPLLIAANREEFYDRPSLGPAIQAGPPRVLCGVDARAGGTWLGVNEHGVVAAVTNRPKPHPGAAPRLLPAAGVLAPAGPTAVAPRSRGLLCRELLNFRRAADAARFAYEQLATGAYDGANFVCLDADYGAVIHAGARLEAVELSPGLHILTAGDVNDASDPRQALARRLFAEQAWAGPREFVEAARHVCSRGPVGDSPGIVVRGDGRGTVSSTILAVARRADESVYHFAAGAPDVSAFQDCSNLARSIFPVGAQSIAAADAARGGFP
jgi:uncharacterized protein with NRDE domain